MERFICLAGFCFFCGWPYLKSNMERFIFDDVLSLKFANLIFKIQYGEIYILADLMKADNISDLKSNMERFIFLKPIKISICIKEFKIQYGEIYIHKNNKLSRIIYNLKSNMERFIFSGIINHPFVN